MRKTFKKTMCVVLSSAMIFTSGDFSNVNVHMPWDFSVSVNAAKNVDDIDPTTEVSTAIVKDTTLLNALKQIVGKGSNITVAQLKAYDGNIDLSSYTGIKSIEGLGYARKAKSFNLSKLTGVTKIPKEEFYSCAMESVSLPSSITEIETYAFAGCEKLASINLPNSITMIHENAFENCYALNNVTLPSGLVKLGGAAFSGCKSIQSIVIPNTLKTDITDVDNDTVKTMGASVFANCESLNKVTFGNQMKRIPDSTFSGCRSLTSVSIPSRIVDIGVAAFAESGLYSVDLSGCTGLVNLGDSAFSRCTSMTSVSLPASLRKINNHTFAACTSLTTVNIAANSNITTIGMDAFGSTRSLTNVTFMKDLKKLTTIGEIAFANGSVKSDAKDIYGRNIYVGGPEYVYIPGTVTTIGQGAFQECRNLEEVYFADMTTIPDGTTVRKIGEIAFLNDWNLTKVTLPEQNNTNARVSVEIGTKAFQNCNWLQTINFPTCLTKIGEYAFSEAGFGKKNNNTKEFDMKGLKNIDLSNNTRLVDIGRNAFEKCYNLDTFKFPKNIEKIPNFVLFQSAIKDSTTNVNTKWYGLDYVDLGQSVKVIGQGSFKECAKLNFTNDLFPKTLITIGDESFATCATGGSLTFPENLETIGKGAFSKCNFYYSANDWSNWFSDPKYGLKEVNFGKAKKLKSIGQQAFEYTPIKSVEFDASAPLDSIKQDTFYGCLNLETVKLSDSVQDIGASALGACKVLKTLNTPATTILDRQVVMTKSKSPNVPKTNMFTFVTRVPSNKINVRVNEHDEMGIYSLVYNDKSPVPGYDTTFSKVTINNSSFKADEDGNSLVAEGTYGTLPITPSIGRSEVKTEGSSKSYSVKTLEFAGNTETKNVPVEVSLKLVLPVTQGDSTTVPSVIPVTGNIVYNVDVTKVPCESISQDDVYIGVDKTKAKSKGTTITPTITPVKTTDKLTWEVDSSNNLIDLEVAEDGKSAVVYAKGNAYGSTQIKLKAGAVTEYFYVYVAAPSNGLKLDKNTLNIPYNTSSSITATITYSSKDYESFYQSNPDHVKFISNDESIVKVGNVTSKIGNTPSSGNTFTCELIAGKIGTTTLTAIAEASGKTATCKISVVASNLKTTLINVDDDTRINHGDSITLYRINASVHKDVVDQGTKTFLYDFTSDDLASNDIEYIVDNDNICKIESYSAANKTFKISAKHAGTTDVTIWPKGFDAAVNGVTFKVKTTADINGLRLKNKTIRSGNVECIIDNISNKFGDVIKNGAADPSTITNNSLEFVSSDNSIATVDGKGFVNVKGAGPVVITCNAYAPDGTLLKTATCTVTAKIGVNDLEISSVPDTVYTGNDIKPVITVKGRGKVLTLGTDYSVEYKDCKNVGTARIKVRCKGNYDGEKEITFKINPRKVTNLRQVGSASKPSITWTAVQEANGYEIFTYSKGNYTKIGTTTSVKYVLKKLKKYKNYKVAVRAYAKGKDGNLYYGDYTTISVTPGMTAVKITKLKVGKRKITISWKRQKNINGYEIYMSTKKKKGFKKIATIKKAKKVKFTKKRLKRKKVYYFKIRAYKKVGKAKIYGPFSKVKKSGKVK
ncbi:Leucine rich repeat-containing protein [Eubacterium uniforme]|uniref:Leucine rich repeat-containing protein n=1 Tax=Eubacterium uniforme TaxID=39495 RepID=A0A1T4VN57_9FIRM|nr:leucine-rich repeat domain-containing protein [Eubacterium uniforme]SKA66404.1 Leucine rich repeat-containing protein [Eubacterium uniforme]